MSAGEVFVLHSSWSEASCLNLTVASQQLKCICRALKPAGIKMQRLKLCALIFHTIFLPVLFFYSLVAFFSII